jgi:electron transport complex protein RnfG
MNKSIAGIAVMTAICAASGGGLAALKDVTAPLIEQQVLTYVQEPTLTSLFPSAENDLLADRKKFIVPDAANPEKNNEVTVFPIQKNGNLTAVALENFGTGYGGALGIMVGIDVKSDTVIAILPTVMKETPGIGTRIVGQRFLKQFKGLDASNATAAALKSGGGQIDAISGATVSSGAVSVAVQAALKQYAALKNEILQTWQ